MKGKTVISVDTISALKALPKTGDPHASVGGYYALADGGGGMYSYDASDTTSPDNGGTVIVASDGGRWKLSITTVISAKQWGAKGDNIQIDTPFLRNALSYAAIGGGKLFIPRGTYKTDSLSISGNVQLIGEGSGATVLQFLTNGISMIGTAGPEQYQNSIRDIRIQGNPHSGTGLYIEHAHNGTFMDMEIIGFNTGLSMRNSWVNSFFRCRFHDNNTGATIYQNSNDVQFFGSSFNNNLQTGIIIRGCWNVGLIGTDIEYNLQRGVSIRGHAGGSENDYSTSNINIIDCYIEENGTAPGSGRHIEIGGFGSSPDVNSCIDIHIDKNIFYETHPPDTRTMDAGVAILKCDGTSITQNTGLNGNGYATGAVVLYPDSKRSLFRSNRLDSSQIAILEGTGATFHEDQEQTGQVTVNTDGTGAGYMDVSLTLPYPTLPTINAITALTNDPSVAAGAVGVRNLSPTSFRLRVSGAVPSTAHTVLWRARGSQSW